jgi:hypothetical protein
MDAHIDTPTGPIPVFGIDKSWIDARESTLNAARVQDWWTDGVVFRDLFAGEGLAFFADFPNGSIRYLAVAGTLPPSVLAFIRAGKRIAD